MTEQDWLACEDSWHLLTSRPGAAGDRKLRLFAVACCRRIWHRLADPRSRKAVLVAERFAVGDACPEELKAAHEAARRVAEAPRAPDAARAAADTACPVAGWAAARGAASAAASDAGAADYGADVAERAAQAALLRDILGNPFRPARIDPGQFTPDVVSLALIIYDQQTFDRMPELGDRLAKAGCRDEQVRAHCRSGKGHARGCWVLDTVLGLPGVLTEAEWQGCNGVEPMLAHLRGRSSDRQMRLFACACLRRVWSLLPDRASREAVEVAERFAEGLAGAEDLAAAHEAAQPGVWDAAVPTAGEAAERSSTAAAHARAWAGDRDIGGPLEVVPAHLFHAMKGDAGGADVSDWDRAEVTERWEQAPLLRCVANPWQAQPVSPAVRAWNGGAAVKLAQAAYEGRSLPEGALDAGRLAILADALEEAGCADAELLGHLRGPGPHVRGCWAVDAILGRS